MLNAGRGAFFLAFGLLLAEYAALGLVDAARQSWWRFEGVLFHGTLGVLGIGLVSYELSRAAAEGHGGVAGMLSWRPRIVWPIALLALLMTAAVLPHARSLTLPTAIAAGTLALALGVAFIPFALVPAILIDHRIGVRRAFSSAVALLLHSKLSDILRGPVLFAVSALLGDAIASAFQYVYPWPYAAAFVALLGLGLFARGALAQTVALSQSAIRLQGKPTASGLFFVSLPIALAFGGQFIAVALLDWGTNWWWNDRAAAALGAVGSATAVVLAWVVFEGLRHLSRERDAAPPTLILLDASDVEVDAGLHRMREGASIVLAATGVSVPAPAGMAVHGFGAETSLDALVDAWVDAPLPPTGAPYRGAPVAFPSNASIVVGHPSGARVDRMLALLDRIAIPFVIVSTTLVLTTAVAIARHVASDG